MTSRLCVDEEVEVEEEAEAEAEESGSSISCNISISIIIIIIKLIWLELARCLVGRLGIAFAFAIAERTMRTRAMFAMPALKLLDPARLEFAQVKNEEASSELFVEDFAFILVDYSLLFQVKFNTLA